MARNRAVRLERWTLALVSGLTLGSLILLWSVFLGSALGTEANSRARQVDRLQRSARVIATGLDHVLGESRLAMDILSVQIRNLRERDLSRDPEFRESLASIRAHDQGEVDLRAIDATGMELPLGAGFAPVSVADREYFLVQVPYPGPGYFIDGPIRSRTSGRWELVLSHAVPPNQGAIAVLAGILEFSRLDVMVRALGDDPESTITLYRGDGTALYTHPLPQAFPQGTSPSPLAAIVQTQQESGLLGGTLLSAFQKVDGIPLWVVVSRPSASMNRYWERGFFGQLPWVVVLSGALLLAALGLAYLLRSLRRIRVSVEELSRTDPLTSLMNRRAFFERCELEQRRLDRHEGTLALALLDLDHFKEVNDRFGHLAGDQALRDFGAALVRTVRSTDALARIGGEEFAILFTSGSEKAAVDSSERVRAEVEGIALPEGNLTTSIGVALWDGKEPFEAWYHRADQALYRAKTGGRNRVETAHPAQ